MKEFVGLANFGNTCFFNSILQILAYFDLFVHYLEVSCSAYRLSKRGFSRTLLETLKAMRSGSSSVIRPSALYSLVKKVVPSLSSGQQDAEEFFHVIFNSISEEIEKGKRSLSAREGLASVLELPSSPDRPCSIVTNPFQGLMSSDVLCHKCGQRRAINNQLFVDISVSVPAVLRGITITLDHCLDKFISDEDISGVECESCCSDHLLSRIQTKCGESLRPQHVGAEDVLLMVHSTLLRTKQAGVLAHSLKDSWGDHLRANILNPLKHKVIPRMQLKGMSDQITSILENNSTSIRSTISKKLLISKCPEVLCIHLVRRVVDPRSAMMMKVDTYVSFPSVLCLDKYMCKNVFDTESLCKNGSVDAGLPSVKALSKLITWRKTFKLCGNGKYMSLGRYYSILSQDNWIFTIINTRNKVNLQLCCVVVHSGNENSGHFYSFVKSEMKSMKWFCISDDKVYPVNEKEVLKAQAYMLFYQRIE